MALLGGRATGTPELALGLSEAGRDWRLGWTLGLARTERASFHFSLEATRWEPANGDATPENRVGVTASMRWYALPDTAECCSRLPRGAWNIP